MSTGFQTAPLHETADYAGFSKGAFYSNFRSKDDMLLTSFENDRERRIKSDDAALI